MKELMETIDLSLPKGSRDFDNKVEAWDIKPVLENPRCSIRKNH